MLLGSHLCTMKWVSVGSKKVNLARPLFKRSLLGLTDLPVSHVHPHTLQWELYVEDGMV